MIFLNILSIAICLIALINGQNLKANDEKCLNHIKYLSTKDRCLSSRRQFKVDKAKLSTTPEYFFALVALSKCEGTAFACGLTTSYVTEIFQGLKNQYLEYKNDNQANGEAAGYSLYIGDDIRNLFKDNKNSIDSIAYNMRHIGTEDHVWTIEQLANGTGYRIYQSYFESHSLKAWLSEKLDGLYTTDNNGDIMVFTTLQAKVNAIIKKLTSDKYDITTLDNAPLPENVKEFCRFVKNYDSTSAINDFKKAWDVYGKGRVLNWTEMENYINILADMTEYLNKNQNTPTPFDETIYKNWIDLFGSPNPVHFPNLPNNLITDEIFDTKRTYRFEIKTIKFKPSNCDDNIQYININ